MDDLFSATVADDLEYKRLRDEPQYLLNRKFVESLWQRFFPLADSGFVNKIAANFQAHFWEMYLGCVLEDAGMKISSKDSGPDLRVERTANPIWVEAIAPTQGKGADAVTEPVTDDESGCQVPEDQVVLRLRSAIEDKHKKRQGYIESAAISDVDPYIIAVNGCRVPFFHADDEPQYIVKAVYPYGMHTITVDSKTGQIVKQGYQHRPQIAKKSGAPVATTVFQDALYSGISAIIYSCADAWTVPSRLGNDFLLLHNPLAANPIDRDWLKVGTEYWATKTELAKKIWAEDSYDDL